MGMIIGFCKPVSAYWEKGTGQCYPISIYVLSGLVNTGMLSFSPAVFHSYHDPLLTLDIQSREQLAISCQMWHLVSFQFP